MGSLYSNGMHDFVLREFEVGYRVAMSEEGERCGWSPFLNWLYELDQVQGQDLRTYGEDFPDFTDVDALDEWLRNER